MGNVNLLSSKDSTNFRNIGVSKEVKSLPRLLRLSSSVALVGFGIHTWRNNFNDTTLGGSKEYSKRGRLNRRFQLQPNYWQVSSENLPLTRKKWRDSGFSWFFNSIKIFNVVTPVSCEDVICTCSRERNDTISSKLIQRCECQECRGGTNSTNKNIYPPSKQEKPTSCGTPNKGPKSSCSGGTPTSVSNKPCKSASKSCAQVTDVDIDALSAQLGGLKQVEFVVDSDLSHCFLIKQASQVAVDSVTRILTETASAYEDYHTEYRRLMDTMMDTLEESRKACGAELEMIDLKIVLIRAKVDEMKRRIADLDMFLCSLEKLGNASAETAFMANAEYASIAMSERLQSLSAEVKRIRDESKEKERDMLDLQALIIVETGKSLK